MTRTILAALFAMGMLLGMAAMASAAAIQCGDCHGDDATNNPLPTATDGCDNDARELHGVHFNYSSSDLPKSAATTDKCAYCHVAVTGTAPTATHNDNTVDIASTKAGSLSFDDPSNTCTDSCHANNSNTAKWGNYTAVIAENIKLTCDSCHDDASEGSSTSLSGAHFAHLSTVITVSGLGNGTNADCAACHPDNVNDFWSGGQADDGSVKAYPHASDGTNVVSSNATVNAGFTGTNCTAACHTNTTADVWTDTSLTCNACHYYTSGTIMGGSHDKHVINQSHPCTYCHSVPGAGDTSHVTAMPAAADNAAVISDPGPNTGASWTDATNTCANTGSGCHDANSVVWGATLGCDGCHNFPDGNNWSANNGHAVQYDTGTVVNTHLPLATAFNAATDSYDTLCADTTKCGKCHYGLTEASNHKKNGVEVVPAGNNYCGAGDFTKTGTGNATTCNNVSCHSGQTTPQWN